MNSAATRKNLAVKNSQVVQVYKEVIHADHIAWFIVGCFEGKPTDYWPAENERIEVLQDCWFDRIGTNRLPIRAVTKAVALATKEKVNNGRVYPR